MDVKRVSWIACGIALILVQAVGAQQQTTGPLSLILGPVGDVKPYDFGNPLAPSTDTNYIEIPPDEWPPDEFLSNPDHEFDWRDLKGWHFNGLVEKVVVLGNRKIKAGESVRFESIVKDVTGTANRMAVTYRGPQGRRSTLDIVFTPVTPGSSIFRSDFRTSKWAEPGIYRLVDVTPTNETRHNKSYYPDYHPGLRGVEFEILPNPDADVVPPEIAWIKVNTLEAPDGGIRTQRITEPLPIFAKVTDNKSGVKSITVRFVNPNGQHFIEARLNRVIGKPDIYGAMLTIPDSWPGGEYKLLSAWATDHAEQTSVIFQTTHAALKNAKVILQQDPAKVDSAPPVLHSVWVEQERAQLGQPVRVNAVITDDKSGVGTVAVMFAPHPSYIDRVRVHLRPVPKADVVQKSGLDISANLWTGTVETIPWFEPGEWRVDRVTARDNADNFLDMLPENFPELSSVKIEFTGGINLAEQMRQQKKTQGRR